MPFVVFFALCGLGAAVAAGAMTRYLWREDQRMSAAVVGSLTGLVSLSCFASAWIWWDGVLF